jgi:hypothetical protein
MTAHQNVDVEYLLMRVLQVLETQLNRSLFLPIFVWQFKLTDFRKQDMAETKGSDHQRCRFFGIRQSERGNRSNPTG